MRLLHFSVFLLFVFQTFCGQKVEAAVERAFTGDDVILILVSDIFDITSPLYDNFHEIKNIEWIRYAGGDFLDGADDLYLKSNF